MATPANIIINFKNDCFLIPKGKDQILLFCNSDGYPFLFQGAIYLIVRAYENLKNSMKFSENSNMLDPENFASELIRFSYIERSEYYRISPATRLMFKQYDTYGYFVDKGYEYICNFITDEHNNYDMSLTLKAYNNETTKNVEEWKKVSDIAYQISHVDNETAVLMDDFVPCSKCLVRPTCIDVESEISFAKEICDDLKKYKKKESSRLRKKLPDWAVPFV